VAVVVVELVVDVVVVGEHRVRSGVIVDGAAVACGTPECGGVIGRERAGRAGVVDAHPPGGMGAPGVRFVGRGVTGGWVQEIESGVSEGGCVGELDARADRRDGREARPFLAVVTTGTTSPVHRVYHTI
jgi:hypothetical protein